MQTSPGFNYRTARKFASIVSDKVSGKVPLQNIEYDRNGNYMYKSSEHPLLSDIKISMSAGEILSKYRELANRRNKKPLVNSILDYIKRKHVSPLVERITSYGSRDEVSLENAEEVLYGVDAAHLRKLKSEIQNLPHSVSSTIVVHSEASGNETYVVDAYAIPMTSELGVMNTLGMPNGPGAIMNESFFHSLERSLFP